MKLGRMNNKITVKKLNKVKNNYGEFEETWINQRVNIWASKENLLGKEFFAAEASQSKVEVKFRTHFYKELPELDEPLRIHHGNLIYDIISVIDPEDRRKELLFYCKKVKQ